MITTEAELEQRIGELMMRHHYTRPDATGVALTLIEPAVITGEFTATADHEVNPYKVHAAGAALVMGVAGLGASWSVAHDAIRADLAVGVFFLAILLFTLLQGRSIAWEQA